MKWYRNKQMLNETFEQNINYLQKTKSEKTQCLLADYNNLILDHLELLNENEKLKKALKILTHRIIIKAHRNFLFGGRYLDVASTTMKLTDEEYELLKEAVENEL